MAKNDLNWLHISDIHYEYSGYKTEKMRNKLVDYLKSLSINFSFVLLTGDIAYKNGNYSEELYNFLINILSVLKLSSDKLYIVPGNHDVKRTEHRKTLIKGILSNDEYNYHNLDSIAEETYNSLIDGQTSFFDFYHKIKNEEYDKNSLHFIKEEVDYNIVHLNTCLLSGIEEEKEGSLLINQNKLYKLLSKLNGDKLNIAIGHHGINCFNENDQTQFLNNLSDANIDMYLYGHQHKVGGDFLSSGYKSIPQVVSGSNISDKYSDTSIMIGNFEKSLGICTIRCHSWNKEAEYWHIDQSKGRVFSNGSMEFKVERLLENTEKPILVINEDEFSKFLLEFVKCLDKLEKSPPKINMIEITDKFSKMLCNKAIVNQFSTFSIFFELIDSILNNPSIFDFFSRISIPNVVISEYNTFLKTEKNGDSLIETITESLYVKYKGELQYPETRLKMYLKAIIYWSINSCDIFNDSMGD